MYVTGKKYRYRCYDASPEYNFETSPGHIFKLLKSIPEYLDSAFQTAKWNTSSTAIVWIMTSTIREKSQTMSKYQKARGIKLT